MEFTIFLKCFILICITSLITGIQSHSDHKAVADDLRERYSIGQIVRDREHIRKDISTVVNLIQIGEITHYEAVFYYVRMHDFDENRQLDGLELLISFQHEGGSNADNITKLEKSIDAAMREHDLNDDGFLDFPEFAMSIKP